MREFNLGAFPFLEAIFGGGKGGGVYKRGASNTNFPLQRGRLLDKRRLFESGRLLDHLR